MDPSGGPAGRPEVQAPSTPALHRMASYVSVKMKLSEFCSSACYMALRLSRKHWDSVLLILAALAPQRKRKLDAC